MGVNICCESILKLSMYHISPIKFLEKACYRAENRNIAAFLRNYSTLFELFWRYCYDLRNSSPALLLKHRSPLLLPSPVTWGVGLWCSRGGSWLVKGAAQVCTPWAVQCFHHHLVMGVLSKAVLTLYFWQQGCLQEELRFAELWIRSQSKSSCFLAFVCWNIKEPGKSKCCAMNISGSSCNVWAFPMILNKYSHLFFSLLLPPHPSCRKKLSW